MPDQPSEEPPLESDGPLPSAEPTAQPQTPAFGRRQAFDDVLRPLTTEDLASPGTQKIILYMLQQTQAENDALGGYVERFHEADKRAAVLQQQLDHERVISRATDIAVTAGTTIGGAVLGVAFYFFGKTQPDNFSGAIALVLGFLLVAGALAIKAAKR